MSEVEIKKQLDEILKKYEGVTYEDLTESQSGYLINEFLTRARGAYSGVFSDPKSSPPPLSYSHRSIRTIVEQVWKRQIYFRVFHDGVKGMNELKEAALYSFWILKLQPFFISGHTDPTNKLNVLMALKVLLNGVIAYVAGMNQKEADKKAEDSAYKTKTFRHNFNQPIIEELAYSFLYRDWSKEALMDLARSLVIIE
ncbi:MAG: hypothetical protein LBC70_01685 [Chitinispirillales bacterium]|jgi:hypothetical protein|nr:hypothetical protein [Chitinispirillales bacterium]